MPHYTTNRVRLVFSLTLVAIALACVPDDDSDGGIVTSDGGGEGALDGGADAGIDGGDVVISDGGMNPGQVTVTSPDGVLTLTIPAGAMPAGTDVGITLVNAANVPAAVASENPLGEVYDLTPDGLEFERSVQATFDLDEAAVADMVNENGFPNLEYGSYSDGTITRLSNAVTTYDSVNATAISTANIDHFSLVWRRLATEEVRVGGGFSAGPFTVGQRWTNSFVVSNPTSEVSVFPLVEAVGCQGANDVIAGAVETSRTLPAALGTNVDLSWSCIRVGTSRACVAINATQFVRGPVITCEAVAPTPVGPCTPETRISLTNDAPLVVEVEEFSILNSFNGCNSLFTNRVGQIEKLIRCAGAACVDVAVPTTGAAFRAEIANNGLNAVFRSSFGFGDGVTGEFNLYKLTIDDEILGPIKAAVGAEVLSGNGTTLISTEFEEQFFYRTLWHEILGESPLSTIPDGACSNIQTGSTINGTQDRVHAVSASGDFAVVSEEGGYAVVRKSAIVSPPVTLCDRVSFDDFPGEHPSLLVASEDLSTIAGLVPDPSPDAFYGALFFTKYNGNPYNNPNTGVTTMVARNTTSFDTDYGVRAVSVSRDGRYLAYVQVGAFGGNTADHELWVLDTTTGVIAFVSETKINMFMNPSGANIIHHDAATSQVLVVDNPLCNSDNGGSVCDPG